MTSPAPASASMKASPLPGSLGKHRRHASTSPFTLPDQDFCSRPLNRGMPKPGPESAASPMQSQVDQLRAGHIAPSMAADDTSATSAQMTGQESLQKATIALKGLQTKYGQASSRAQSSSDSFLDISQEMPGGLGSAAGTEADRGALKSSAASSPRRSSFSFTSAVGLREAARLSEGAHPSISRWANPSSPGGSCPSISGGAYPSSSRELKAQPISSGEAHPSSSGGAHPSSPKGLYPNSRAGHPSSSMGSRASSPKGFYPSSLGRAQAHSSMAVDLSCSRGSHPSSSGGPRPSSSEGPQSRTSVWAQPSSSEGAPPNSSKAAHPSSLADESSHTGSSPTECLIRCLQTIAPASTCPSLLRLALACCTHAAVKFGSVHHCSSNAL